MARPALGVVLAASAPHCIWPAGKDGRPRVPPWALLAHGVGCFLAVINARQARHLVIMHLLCALSKGSLCRCLEIRQPFSWALPSHCMRF